MTDPELHHRLRERVPSASPPPGLEPRLRAIARNSPVPHRGHSPPFPWVRFLALPALALVILVVAWPSAQPPTPEPPVTRLPTFKPLSTTKIQEPVRHEFEALQREARWTAGLVRRSLPSIPRTSREEPRR